MFTLLRPRLSESLNGFQCIDHCCLESGRQEVRYDGTQWETREGLSRSLKSYTYSCTLTYTLPPVFVSFFSRRLELRFLQVEFYLLAPLVYTTEWVPS